MSYNETELNLDSNKWAPIFVYKLQYMLTSKIADFILLAWLQTNYYVTCKTSMKPGIERDQLGHELVFDIEFICKS